MVFFDARVVYFFSGQVRRSNSERVLQEIFSHRAIIYVMSTCICLFVASLCFLFFFLDLITLSLDAHEVSCLSGVCFRVYKLFCFLS